MPSWGYDITKMWETICFGAVIVICILVIIGLTMIWIVAFHRKSKSRKETANKFVVFSAVSFCFAAYVGLSAIILYTRGSGILMYSYVIIYGYLALIVGFGFLAHLNFSNNNDLKK